MFVYIYFLYIRYLFIWRQVSFKEQDKSSDLEQQPPFGNRN